MTNKFTQKGIYLTEGGVLVKIVNTSNGILSTDAFAFNWYENGDPFANTQVTFSHKNIKLKCLTDLTELPSLPEGYLWKNPLNEKYGKKIIILEKTGNDQPFIALDLYGRSFKNVLFSLPNVSNYKFEGLRPLLVKKSSMIPPKNFTKDGIYLTEGGYLVDLKASSSGFLYVDVNDVRHGWVDGVAHSATHILLGKNATSLKELTTLKELPKPPKGYKWKDEFNQKYGDKIVKIHHPEENDKYCPMGTCSFLIGKVNTHYKNDVLCSTLNQMRPLVTRVESAVETTQNPVSVSVEEKVMSTSNPTPEQQIASMKTVAKTIAKTSGNIALRTANYWVVQPAIAYVSRIGRSVRYVTFLAMVGGSVYGYYNPDAVVSFVKKCVPKVTIEAPEIMQG